MQAVDSAMRLQRALMFLSIQFVGVACTYAKDGSDCRPRQVLPTLPEPRFISTATGAAFPEKPTCTVDERGAIILSFIPPVCDPLDSWWAGCAFRLHQDMRAFDAGKDGILVAKLCVESLPPVAVNLRYGPSGDSKFIKLLPGSLLATTTTCITVNLGSADACDGADRCGPSCTGDYTSAKIGSCQVLSDSDLVVMAEWCQATEQPLSTSVTIRLESLIHYPSGCACHDDSDCTSPWVCRNDGWADTARCSAIDTGCPAFCSPGVPALSRNGK